MVSKNKKTCPDCGGKGWVIAWTTDRNGKRISYEITCHTCHGTGEI